MFFPCLCAVITAGPEACSGSCKSTLVSMPVLSSSLYEGMEVLGFLFSNEDLSWERTLSLAAFVAFGF